MPMLMDPAHDWLTYDECEGKNRVPKEKENTMKKCDVFSDTYWAWRAHIDDVHVLPVCDCNDDDDDHHHHDKATHDSHR